LCVLLGAAGLSPDHQAAVIVDVAAIHATIDNGLRTIHSLVPLCGNRAQESEKFLQQLHRVAFALNEQVWLLFMISHGYLNLTAYHFRILSGISQMILSSLRDY
jgi:hypothetical protein